MFNHDLYIYDITKKRSNKKGGKRLLFQMMKTHLME